MRGPARAPRSTPMALARVSARPSRRLLISHGCARARRQRGIGLQWPRMAADVAAEVAAEMTAEAAAEVTAQVAAQVVTEAVADEGYISRTSAPAMPDNGALRRERQGAELGDERGMSWERLLTVRDELFADDVPLPTDVNLSRWSEARARRYFESGGLEGQIETV